MTTNPAANHIPGLAENYGQVRPCSLFPVASLRMRLAENMDVAEVMKVTPAANLRLRLAENLDTVHIAVLPILPTLYRGWPKIRDWG
jgi:hypothetical protein